MARASNSAQVHSMTFWLEKALATRVATLETIREGVARRADVEPDLVHFMCHVTGFEDGHGEGEALVPAKLQTERIRAQLQSRRKKGKAQRQARRVAR